MILPPTASAVNFGMQILKSITGGQFSIFVDMQAEVTELDMERYLVEHQIPSREGGSLQDIGSKASVLMIKGKWIYENQPSEDILDLVPALNFFGQNVGWNWLRVQLMRTVYYLKEPLFIGCNLINTAVMIHKMKFKEVGGKPNVYDYTMVLKEYNPLLGVVGGAAIPIRHEGAGY